MSVIDPERTVTFPRVIRAGIMSVIGVAAASAAHEKGDAMYTFAVLALLALALVKLVDALVDYSGLKETAPLRALLTFVGALAAVWLLDFSMFEQWGIDIRSRSMGIWMTGFAVAGFTVAWRAAFGYLTHDRATKDETLGEHPRLEKVA
jgi:hypothetical protein